MGSSYPGRVCSDPSGVSDVQAHGDVSKDLQEVRGWSGLPELYWSRRGRSSLDPTLMAQGTLILQGYFFIQC